MRRFHLLGMLLAGIGLTALYGCSSVQSPVAVQPGPEGKEIIPMQASNYEFKPNNIHLPQPGTLTLEVKNVSDTTHNITVMNPRGQLVKSVDLPPKQTVPVHLVLTEPGEYDFHCDKPFHTTLGMVGKIVVGP